ncbi:hypothetical protein [Bryobacter aggregatus]|uniref:hypothetical protein n=1 Tax=Bryobacter aggregatus TaxID=360054 RepID=UPI00138DEAB4|nr:hypothetical protein [Bryobacter aggregatus]
MRLNFALAFLLIWSACGVSDNRVKSQQLSSLAADCEAGRIGRIELFHIRSGTFFRASVSPENLERWSDYKLNVRSLGSVNERDLISTLKSAVVTTSKVQAYLRWGIAFYDRNDAARVRTIYFEESGKYGYIDNAAVCFESDVAEHLKNIAREAFR